MIYVNYGKNKVICNSNYEFGNYSITFSKLNSKDINLSCYVMNKTDLYVELEFVLNSMIEGEYDYVITADDKVIDCGISKIINNNKSKNYITYGK